ncbi:hypothetical protein MKX01_023656 [Papaver californicum]|nr:hypothetical protein MKX01_023656 [Papaver californicum]
MASSSDQVQFRECYQNWMIQQQELLKELLQVYNQKPNDEQELQNYNDRRAQLANDDAPCFFSPTWCSSIENSHFWLGGCRPSLMIRFVYSLCGSQFESQLTEFLQGVRKGNIGELSASQLSLLSELQCKTILEEKRLSKKMASLQENIADYPLTRLANNSHFEQVDQALDSHSKDLASILVEDEHIERTSRHLDTITSGGISDCWKETSSLSMHQWGQNEYDVLR